MENLEAQGHTSAGHVSPNDGGCWYCMSTDGNLLFSVEFDTFVHSECLMSHFAEHKDDVEAEIMIKEMGIECTKGKCLCTERLSDDCSYIYDERYDYCPMMEGGS